MNYRITVPDRKPVIDRLYELTGKRARYTNLPRCAYLVQSIAIEANGTIMISDDEDRELIDILIAAGLVQKVAGEESQGGELIAEDPAQGNAFSDPEYSGRPNEPREAAEPAGAADVVDAEQNTADDPSDTEDYYHRYDVLAAPQLEIVNAEIIRPVFRFSLSPHHVDSIRNLIYTVYSRGSLMSKATGGDFYVSEGLADRLQWNRLMRMDEVLETISNAVPDALRGITFDSESVIFDGFPETGDAQRIDAFRKLAECINETALRQRHIYPKSVDDTNEKFSFRIWLNRIRMGGPENKEARKILYGNLSGNTCFRTPEDAERWAVRRIEENGRGITPTARRQEGDLLKKRREALGLTTEDLYARTGIVPEQYSRFENGERSIRYIPFQDACQILKTLEMDIDMFFQDPGISL